MHAPVARLLLLLAVPASLAAEACVHPSDPPGSSRAAIPEQPPAPPTPVIAAPRPREELVDLRPARDDRDAIPTSWSTAYGHHVPYAEAVVRARKRTMELETAVADDAGAIGAVELERITAGLDAMTRAWATVFHAPDATMTDKLDAVNVAAAASLAGSRRLDALGLHDTAGGFHTDARVALSYEDVTEGPGRHWRSEGLALARLCMTLASRDRAVAVAERCARLERDYPAVTQRTSSRGCACDPGDPLCTSSMSGWCPPGR